AAGIKNRPRPSRADARADLRMDVANRQVLTLNLAAGSPPHRGWGHRTTTLLRPFRPHCCGGTKTATRRVHDRRLGQPSCSTFTARTRISNRAARASPLPRLASPLDGLRPRLMAGER